MKSSLFLAAIAFALLIFPAAAEAVKDREGAVRNDRATMENDPRWIYNDWQKGFAEARRTGRPLLVVLRCVPCLACAGIDAQVLLNDADTGPLLDQFVCVRLINANTIDLSLFQFDHDLSFTTLLFNGDGTLYGRYGSWTHQRDAQDRTTAGFRRALEGALKLHGEFPTNKAALAGKQGRPVPHKSPLDIPTLSGKYTADLNWSGKVVPSCIHCHQIGDALRLGVREKKQPMPADLVYPWPQPETVGLALAPDHVARVESVVPGSAAARAGFLPGDEMVSFAGQPLLSIADVSWVLHGAADTAALAAEVRRGGAVKKLTLSLAPGWRAKSDISRRVGTWPMRGMATGGLVLEALPEAEQTAAGVAQDKMALRVKSVGQYGKHAAGKHAGFQKGDVLVDIAGQSARMNEGEVIGHLLRHHFPGERVPVTVLRGGERLKLSLPMQ